MRTNEPKGTRRRNARTERREEAQANPEKFNKSGKRRSSYDKFANDTGLRVTVNDFKNRTKNHIRMTDEMDIVDILVTYGPPGTGKTALATLKACEYLHKGIRKKIILTRPIVEIGKTIGFLPGTVEEKFAPYLIPFIEHLNTAFGVTAVEKFIKDEKICPMAVNFVQGQTWHDSIILIDEAQNLTPEEMFMLLTRCGRNSSIVITGDYKLQTATKDLKHSNGLEDFLNKVDNKANGIDFGDEELSIIEFTVDDNVRSGISKKVTMLYS